MKKSLLFLFFSIYITSVSYSADYTSFISGPWNDFTKWSGGVNAYPGQYNTNDNATINGETMTLAVPVPWQISSLTCSAGSLTINSGGTIAANCLTISGGSVIVDTGAILTVSGLTLTSGSLIISNGGHLIIRGTSTLASGTSFINHGTLTLDGGTGGMSMISNLSSFDNSGTININTPDNTESFAMLTISGAFNNMGTVNIFNGTMEVEGPLTNGGSLLLKSAEEYTGTLIHNTAGITATIERYITGDWSSGTSGWHFLSSPVMDQDIFAVAGPPPIPNFVRSGLNGGATFQDFYYFSEPLDQWINSVDINGNPAFGFEDRFIECKGYMVSYPEGHQPNPRIFSGVVNTASITLNSTSEPLLTRSENNTHTGWNLLGNPYSCSLKWNDGNWGLNNIGGVAKIWNGSGQSYTDVVAGTGIIPVTQGFMVYVSEATGVSLTIPAASRTSVNKNWMKETATPGLKLKACSADNSSYQESAITFDASATVGYDSEIDSYFLSGYAPMLYSCIGNKEYLSTNCLPFNEPLQASVDMGFIKSEEDTYTIEASGIESFPLETIITLEDNKTGRKQNLRANPVYAFTSEEQDDPGRFAIHFDTPGVGYEITDATCTNPFTVYIAGNTLSIAAPGEVTDYAFFVSDMLGRIMLNRHIKTQGTCKTLMNLEPGIYVVTVIRQGNKYSKKVSIGR